MALFSGLKTMLNASDAKKKTESTRSTHSHAIMLSGCKDVQTSADTHIGGSATGAMSHALIKALSTNKHPTYGQLLAAVREILKNEYSQIPQFSTGHPVDMNTIFAI